MEKKCCICGTVFDGYGNNALPIKDGTCCDKCNEVFVFPARLHSSPEKLFVTYTVCPTKKIFETNSKLLSKNNFYHTGIMYVMSCFHNDETNEDVILVPSWINNKEEQ